MRGGAIEGTWLIGRVFDVAGFQFCEIHVEHHHNEQEQHHHGTYVDQHQSYGQELGLEQHPDHCRLEKSQHQVKRRMHGVARRDDTKCRKQHDRRKRVEKNGFIEIHGS